MARAPEAWVLAAGWLAIAGSGCRAEAQSGSTPGCELVGSGDGPRGEQALRVETVVTGLEVPWAVALLPGGDLLLTERPGRVRLVRGGRLVDKPVATLQTVNESEGGLLGLALHPAFASNRLFYLYVTISTDAGPRNRVERWRLAEDGLSAVHDRVIVDGIPAARNHDGGRLRFGPDDRLYIGTGDAAQPPLAQDPGSLAGKVLRLTADGEIPADNPFPGQAAFILGVRNTEGFDFADEGTLYLTDHGPSGELGGRRGHDEVNVAAAGANLGWPTIYGCQARPGLRAPILTWTRAVPPGGAAIYKGSAIPAWRGSLLVGTLASEHLHRAVIDPKSARLVRHEVYLKGAHGRLREVYMAPDGQLYVTTSNCDGRGRCPPEKDVLLRITAAAP